jgi:hypothetical protein
MQVYDINNIAYHAKKFNLSFLNFILKLKFIYENIYSVLSIRRLEKIFFRNNNRSQLLKNSRNLKGVKVYHCKFANANRN